jgi:hypothetical protein
MLNRGISTADNESSGSVSDDDSTYWPTLERLKGNTVDRKRQRVE